MSQDDETPPGFDPDDSDNVVAFRHPDSGQPVVVPRELALKESRHFKAYVDYLQGTPWEVIAERYEYADARAAQYDIKQYVESARSLYNSFTKQQAKALAHARLEFLLASAMPSAAKGNAQSLSIARQLVIDMVKLDRLDEVEDDPDAEGARNTVVVVGGSEEEYVGALERATKD